MLEFWVFLRFFKKNGILLSWLRSFDNNVFLLILVMLCDLVMFMIDRLEWTFCIKEKVPFVIYDLFMIDMFITELLTMLYF